jgi:hypothetical protein
MKRLLALLVMVSLAGLASAESQPVQPQSEFDKYYFFPILIIVAGCIVASEMFIKNKLVVKYIWNVALMVSFIVVAATSLLVFLHLQGLYALLSWLHVEFGLVMIWVGFYHAAKRMYFYTKCNPLKTKVCKLE